MCRERDGDGDTLFYWFVQTLDWSASMREREREREAVKEEAKDGPRRPFLVRKEKERVR